MTASPTRVALAILASALLASALLPGAAPAQLQPIKGSLVIVGGGGTTDAIWARFRELAGGDTARIVIVPTAGAEVDTVTPGAETNYYAERLKPASIAMLHTRSKDVANTEAFVAPLKRATGVWFIGGVQSRITDSYLGTRTEQEFAAVLARGGVIGGTSAGAAIMSKVMITGQRTVGTDTVANVGVGFGFLPGAVADQHFVRRNRQGRLVGVLRDNPGLVGLGVDERTALVLFGGSKLQVVGDSEVRIIQAGHACRPIDVKSIRQSSPTIAPSTHADLSVLAREAQTRVRGC